MLRGKAKLHDPFRSMFADSAKLYLLSPAWYYSWVLAHKGLTAESQKVRERRSGKSYRLLTDLDRCWAPDWLVWYAARDRVSNFATFISLSGFIN